MNLAVKVFINRVKTDYKTDFAKAVAYFAKHNVNITFDFQTVDIHGYIVQSEMFAAGQRYIVEGSYALLPNVTGYDVIMFAFNGAEFSPPAIPTSNCSVINGIPFINLQTHPNDPPNLDWTTICHEMMHALVRLAWQNGFPNTVDNMDSYYLNDQPENPLSNFGKQWILLAPFINKSMDTYKYFKASEVVGLKPELVHKLDQARGIASVPFIITSGYRSPSQNALVGGVQDSSHETGLAVDLLIKDGILGEKINSALHQVGFTRFGYYSDNHLHVDMDITKPNPCYWVK